MAPTPRSFQSDHVVKKFASRLGRVLSSPELEARQYDGMLAVAQRVQMAIGATGLVALWAFPGVPSAHKLTVTWMLLGVYLPWSLLSSHTAKLLGPFARIANVVMDLLAIGSFALVIPETRTAVMTGYVLMVAFHAKVHGRAAGFIVTGGVLTVGVFIEWRAAPGLRASAFTIVMYAAVLIGMTVMVDGLTRERRQLIRHFSRLDEALQSLSADPALSATIHSIAAAAKDAVDATFVTVLMKGTGGNLGTAMLTGEPVAVRDLRTDDASGAWVDVAAGGDVRSVVAVPLGSPDEPLGVLNVFWAEAGAFDRTDVALLAAYGKRAGLEVARAVAFDREQQAAARLIEADAMKSEFVARVSHELRTPLTAIGGFISTLLLHWDRIDDITKRDLLERASRNAGELHRMVEQVLAFSRSADHEFSVKPMDCSLAGELSDLLTHLLPVVGRHHVDVDVHPSVMVHADREALHHVLTNLLSNAAKFAPGGSAIHIRASGLGDEVAVSVSDEGPGIPAAEHERIFDRFYRSSSVSARGTGIGLSIVRTYVEQMGGRVWVDSRVGEGATFTFTLPSGDLRHRSPALETQATGIR
jgi:signal transduction histidine kinase